MHGIGLALAILTFGALSISAQQFMNSAQFLHCSGSQKIRLPLITQFWGAPCPTEPRVSSSMRQMACPVRSITSCQVPMRR